MAAIGFLESSVRQDVMTFGLQLVAVHMGDKCPEDAMNKLVDTLHDLFRDVYGFNEPGTLLTWFDDITMWEGVFRHAQAHVNSLPIDMFAQSLASARDKAGAIVELLKGFNQKLDAIHNCADTEVRASSMFFLLEASLHQMGAL